MDSFQLLQILVFLQFLCYGQPSPGSSFSSSIAINGLPPMTQTYQSGPGMAIGYAGSTQPNGTYVYTTSVSRPRYRRQLGSRNDASQQRRQQGAPPGTAPADIDIQRVPPPEVVYVKQTPPPVITFGNLDQTSRYYQNDEIVRLLSKPYTAYVDQELQERGQRGTPAEVYGPPADDGNAGGGDISSHSLGNKFRKPHTIYGPPDLTTFSFNTPDDTSSQDNINGQYIFVSAFPDADQVIDNIPFAPAPDVGFQPPDGALLAPPAPVVNNIPLPSPRKPEKSKFYFKLYPTLS